MYIYPWVGINSSLEKEMATHSSTLAWEIPWTEGTWQATAHEVLRAEQDLATEQQQNG